MPDKPLWCGRLDEIAGELRSRPDPWVDRSLLQALLGVGRRRAQQILAPCVARRIGPSGLADREEVIARLQQLVNGDAAGYELRRRQRFAAYIEQQRRTWLDRPRVLVEAPAAVVNQEIDGLPSGITLGPGQITVRFSGLTEALEKLLALAMAIGNQPERFERLTSAPPD